MQNQILRAAKSARDGSLFGGLSAAILDFGLAKVSEQLPESADTLTLRTRPGALLGTVEYMSAEQVRAAAMGNQRKFSISIKSLPADAARVNRNVRRSGETER